MAFNKNIGNKNTISSLELEILFLKKIIGSQCQFHILSVQR